LQFLFSLASCLDLGSSGGQLGFFLFRLGQRCLLLSLLLFLLNLSLLDLLLEGLEPRLSRSQLILLGVRARP